MCVYIYAIYKAFKYNTHFLHNEDVQRLDNLPYSEKFLKLVLFKRGSGDCSVFLSAISNSKPTRHDECTYINYNDCKLNCTSNPTLANM